MNVTKPIILASGSPRRRELLTLANIPFTVRTSDIAENTTKTLPADIVSELSCQKAMDVAAHMQESCIVIGADTVVAYKNCVLGKPKDAEDAVRMLSMLQGQTHQVYTGVTLVDTEAVPMKCITFFECTEVHVCPMSQAEIESYVSTGEPLDKAGAYGIQGAFCPYISGIAGDYYNVVGLPVSRLYHELQRML